MIEQIIVKNDYASDNTLRLVLRDPEDPNTSKGFAVTSVKGLGPGKATLNSSEWVTIDGSEFQNARLPKRTITLELTFIPTDYDESVADIRMKSYRYFPIKEHVRLEFKSVTNKMSETYYIDGRVEKNEPNIWSKQEGQTIDIVCFDPYFKNKQANEISFSDVIPKFHYAWIDEDEDINQDDPSPYETPEPLFIMSEKINYDVLNINNPSYVTTGGIFTIRANGTVVNPSIFNETTYQRMIFYITMKAGDVIEVDTRKGYKSVILKKGFGENIINTIDITSDWIEMVPGDNLVGFSCEDPAQRNHMDVKVKVRPIYAGI